MKKLLSILAIVALVFTSCKEENSTLDIDGLSKEATVSGTVYYKTDATEVATKGWSAVANETVYVELNYVGGVNKTFTKQTDANGEFSFTVKTTENFSLQPSVKVYFVFDGSQKQADGSGTKTVNGFFKKEIPMTSSATPNQKYFEEIRISSFTETDTQANSK